MYGDCEEAGQYFHKGYLRPLLFSSSSAIPERHTAGSGGMMKGQPSPHEIWAAYESRNGETGKRWRDFRALLRMDLADVL